MRLRGLGGPGLKVCLSGPFDTPTRRRLLLGLRHGSAKLIAIARRDLNARARGNSKKTKVLHRLNANAITVIVLGLVRPLWPARKGGQLRMSELVSRTSAKLARSRGGTYCQAKTVGRTGWGSGALGPGSFCFLRLGTPCNKKADFE